MAALGAPFLFCCLAFRAIHSQELLRIGKVGQHMALGTISSFSQHPDFWLHLPADIIYRLSFPRNYTYYFGGSICSIQLRGRVERTADYLNAFLSWFKTVVRKP